MDSNAVRMFRYSLGCLLVALVLTHSLPLNNKSPLEKDEDPFAKLERLEAKAAEQPEAKGKPCELCLPYY